MATTRPTTMGPTILKNKALVKVIVDLTNIKNQVNQNTYNISVLKGNVNCLNSKFYCLADKVSKIH